LHLFVTEAPILEKWLLLVDTLNDSFWPLANRPPATPADCFPKHKGQSPKENRYPRRLLTLERRRSTPAWQEGRHRLLLAAPTLCLAFYPFERQGDAASAPSSDRLGGAASDRVRLRRYIDGPVPAASARQALTVHPDAAAT